MQNKQSKFNYLTSFYKLSIYHLHTLSLGDNGTTPIYSKIALWVFTLEADFVNVVHDLIDSRESLSEPTFLLPMALTDTTHKGLRSTCLFFVEYWKTFGEYKYYFKKSTKTQRKSNRKTTYFSAVSFNKLKTFSFISWILSLFTC